ncbi:DUF3631 domain-containing protein [Pelagibius sp. Alg239-R121]|uniref:DUF3631 domain-containing protein n=1 Tax=Pelagibius sp. Alg239-R121 TaxID=2993448 RepID=UPI0024A626E1|nr:DUF3631 domain-containing protein [Pelagibius sp. Alg239-R121]
MHDIGGEDDNIVKAAFDNAQTITESPAEAVERLAQLPIMEYEAVRSKEAKALGVRASVLDDEVRKARPQNHTTGDSQVDDLGLFNPEPCEYPVDGVDLLDRITGAIRRYVVMPAFTAEATALWIVHCHCFENWQHTPRLSVGAPEKGCGKSTLLDVIEPMAPRAVKSESLSTAVMFRLIDSRQPTLLIDEADTFIKENEELRGCINAGFAKGGRHMRCIGDDHEVKGFKTYAPVALAGIGNLPGTIEDRSIKITLQRRKIDEYAENFRSDRVDHLREIACEIKRWTVDNEQLLRETEPEMPQSVVNRAADVWRPLLAIADVAGGGWPAVARQAAVHLSGIDEDSSIRVMLLSDIRCSFASRNADVLSSAELCDELAQLEARPWCEWRQGKPMTQPQLARQLAKFGIAPGTVRTGGATPKGYKLSKFREVFSRYLPPVLAATPPQPNDTAGYSDFGAATQSDLWRQENPENSSVPAGCGGVALRKGGTGHNSHVSASDSPKSCVQCGGTIPVDSEPIPASGGNWLHADGACYDQYLAVGRPGGSA